MLTLEFTTLNRSPFAFQSGHVVILAWANLGRNVGRMFFQNKEKVLM